MKITPKHLNSSQNTIFRIIHPSLQRKINQLQIAASERVGKDCRQDKTCTRVLLKDKKETSNLDMISIQRPLMTHSVRKSLP